MDNFQGCTRGHKEHDTKRVEIHLGGPTPYLDYPEVPQELARDFVMEVWDTDKYPVDGGPYCPASDAVSETLLSHGIWEPRETILTLAVLESDSNRQFGGYGSVVDMGSQIGWFSLLAASCGRRVHGIESDPENVRLARRNAELNGFDRLCVHEQVIDENFDVHVDSDAPNYWGKLDTFNIRLVKLDIEGKEREGLGALWPAIEGGRHLGRGQRVDHILMEMSPCFDDYYPDLVRRLIKNGFDVFRLPEKSVPPAEIYPPEKRMSCYWMDEDEAMQVLAEIRQEDWWFKYKGALW